MGDDTLLPAATSADTVDRCCLINRLTYILVNCLISSGNSFPSVYIQTCLSTKTAPQNLFPFSSTFSCQL